MPERFVDAIKALRHIARGNGNVLRIADRIVAAHERETKVEGVCGPITGELRGAWMGQEADTWMFDKERFTQLCDAIDSVHATLEYEYDELRMKFVNANRHAQHVERENKMLKEKLEERDQVDDYRAGYDDGYEDGTKSALTDMSVTHMPLPVDANGVTVHVGDVMEWCDNGDTIEVVGVGDDVVFYIENGVAEWTTPRNKRHRAPDTWERIIDDAEALAREWFNTDMSENEHAEGLDALVARCKKLAGDAE